MNIIVLKQLNYRLGVHAFNCIFIKNREIVRLLERMQFDISGADLLALEEATKSLTPVLKLFAKNKN